MFNLTPVRAALAQPENAVRLQRCIAADPGASRRAVARRVCREFGFVDPRGRWRESSCQAALAALERAGRLNLPAPRPARGGGPSRRLGTPAPPPAPLPARVDGVADLRADLAADDADRQVWNGLMAREHPRGAAVHAGAQLRYLIRSEHGVLGGLGFSAPAFRLAARERQSDGARSSGRVISTMR